MSNELQGLWDASYGRTILLGDRRIRTRKLRIGDRVIYKCKRPGRGEPRFWLGTVVPSLHQTEQFLYPHPSQSIATNEDRWALARSGEMRGVEVKCPSIEWDHEPGRAAVHMYLDRIHRIANGDSGPF